MNRKRRMTRELNLLSAYLDNTLSEKEKRHLEARLETDPELLSRYKDLRKTKLILSRLTHLRAPRNFLLTPEMLKVYQKKPQPLKISLQLASSLAAILLVVLIGFEWATTGGFILGRQMAASPQMEAATVRDEAPPEPLILWSESASGGGGQSDIVGMGSDEPIMAEAPVFEVESGFIEPESAEEPQAEAMEEIAPDTEEPLAPDQEMNTFEAEGQPEDDGELILGLKLDKGGEIIDQSQPTSYAEGMAEPSLMVLRILQITLALVFAASLAALWLFRRRRMI